MIPKEKLNLFASYLPILSIDLLVRYNNKFLLVRRNNYPAKNKFCFVGGIIQKGEKIKGGMKRILKRELNITADNFKFLTYKQFDFPKDFSNLRTKVSYLSLCHEISLNKSQILKIKTNCENKKIVYLSKKELILKKDVLNQVKGLIKDIY